jgi:hypothetical protein
MAPQKPLIFLTKFNSEEISEPFDSSLKMKITYKSIKTCTVDMAT